MSLGVVRPWGSYLVLNSGEGYQVKEIIIEAGMRLSYQSHKLRSEHWFIIEGSAQVTIDGVMRTLSPGQSVDIKVGQAHRIGAGSTGRVVFIEVQSGEYFGEDDIIRLEDDYGRV